MPSQNAWMTVDQAATFLAQPVVTLRRALERNARKAPDGGTISHADGITARKLGRQWRVRLDAGWLVEEIRKPPPATPQWRERG